MADRALIDEWIRVHRELMEQEAAFTDLALKAAQGEISTGQLDDARAKLLGMRELCNAVYGKAFPKARGTGASK